MKKTQTETGIDFTYGEKVRNISNEEFCSIQDLKSLYELPEKSCDLNKSSIGQIRDSNTGEMAHSFIVQKKSDNTYVCFDKQGFKYPFSVHELGSILDFINKDGEKSYMNQE